jgi:hypothetical protein
MTDVSADNSQPKAVTENIKSDDERHRERCQESALFRRAKESSKERKKFKDTGPPKSADSGHRRGFYYTERRQLAGAAKPIAGKYERLSQD